MGDSTYHKHPIQLSDSTINQRPKRRKYESEQRETLAQLLYQLEKKKKKAKAVAKPPFLFETITTWAINSEI